MGSGGANAVRPCRWWNEELRKVFGRQSSVVRKSLKKSLRSSVFSRQEKPEEKSSVVRKSLKKSLQSSVFSRQEKPEEKSSVVGLQSSGKA
jgi:Arc/MetJ-type ribon-helix-helix transcriptional regulator